LCGIAGIFNRNNAPVDIDLLFRMTRTLIHRGPDEEGYFVNTTSNHLPQSSDAPVRSLTQNSPSGKGNAGLGHRRLSIIDLSTGQQPLSNEDGTIWVCFNGEIYNFQTLKKDLEQHGHIFQTNSDTEVIVHAYEEWGERAVERFRGMFAIALWDNRRQRLWLVRDRVGKKPLYYLFDGDCLLFASEIKAILEAPNVSRGIDLTSLSDYLSLLYVPSPKTIFSAIRKLPAGHYAVVTNDSFDVRQYWDLPFCPQHEFSEDRMIDDVLGILDEATRLRMISDVPLGAFLSGGIDSSAIVGSMAQISQEPVITNSISFSVNSYNEVHYARRVAELFSADHHEFHVTPDAIPVIEQLAWHYDEPFADSSAIPTYYVSKTARNNVTVSLSGDGGDENFAGYRRYYFDMRENYVRNLVPHRIRQSFFKTLGRLYPKADFLPRIFRGKAFISNVARDPISAYFFTVSAIDEDGKRMLLHPDIIQRIRGYSTLDLFYQIYKDAPAPDHLSKIQYLDIKTYLCEDILTKVDRASMAVSLEVRCPILDHILMEYVARIPSSLKLKGKNGKRLFKEALKRHLPNDILYRKKMGFGVPILEWLRTDLQDYARELVLDGAASKQYLNMRFVNKIWKEHQNRIRNRATLLWIIMMFNLWHNKFIEK
jgi:asparagine synthase (glutamine-hydrolysing)